MPEVTSPGPGRRDISLLAFAAPRKSYYRARYYDPSIGKFIKEDPIGYGGGINFYTYVDNNPENLADPTGLDATITQSGNTITVSATITIYGDQAEPIYALLWQKAINRNWNLNDPMWNGCKVKFAVTIQADPFHDDPKKATPAQNYIHVITWRPHMRVENNTGNAWAVAGYEKFFSQNSQGEWNQDANDFEVSHEAGHLFGLLDDRNQWTGTPYPGHEKHMMGGGGPVAQDEINRILAGKANACGCKQ